MTRPFAKITRCLAITWVAAATSLAIAQTMPPAQSQTLPAGHPSLDQLTAPTTAPAATGSLTLTLLPGTAGAALKPNEAITVELFHRGAPLKKLEGKTDAQGKVVFAALPVMPPVQALVSVNYAGLTQQVVTPEINGENPNQTIEMKVFETTETQPAWNISMQHMIVQWDAASGLIHVTEMISATTPGDRAWLGAKVGDGRVTMTVPLPENAQDIELGGSFDEQATKIVDGKLVSGGALFPGRSEFRVTYHLPAKDGGAQLLVAHPAAVDNLIVFAPADGTVTALGLSGGDLVDAGEGRVRMFRGQNLAATASELISISNLPKAAAAAAPSMPDDHGAFSARNVAVGGAFILVLVGVGMMMIKKPQAKRA